MTDTVRTVGALLTLLRDGQPPGSIVPQTIRDMLVSVDASAVFNVRNPTYGAAGDGTTDDTLAFTAARTAQIAAGGGIVFVPKGTYLVSTISATGTVPFVMVGEGQKSKIQTTAAANVALTLGDTTPGIEDCLIRDIWLAGTSTNLGGIALGSGSFYAAFTGLSNVRVTGFTGVGAYGISLNAVQEVEVNNCRVQANYDNYYRPATGFCTSTVIRGYKGYIGLATNRGVNLAGVCSDLGILEQVLESNAKAAVYSSGLAASRIIISDCYSESNNTGLGDAAVITLSGSAVANSALRLNLLRHRWHDAVQGLSLDRVEKSVVAHNIGIETPGIITTGNTQCHFQDNAGVSAADFRTIYSALLGSITADDTDPNGKRFYHGKRITMATALAGAGLNLPHGTAPASPVDGDIWTTSAGLYVRINGSTVGPLS